MKYGPNSIMNPEGNEEVRELYYECAECACCKIKGKPNEFASLEDLRCHLAINHFKNYFVKQLLKQFREFGGSNHIKNLCYYCYFEVGDPLEVEPFNDFSDLLSHIGMVHGEKVDEWAKNLGMTLEQKERVKIIKVSNPKVQISTPIKYGPNFDFSAQENPKDLFHDESDAEIEENFCSCCTLPAKPGQKVRFLLTFFHYFFGFSALKLSACGFCNIATYCSLRCQFYDFKGHKKACEFGRKSNGIRKLDVNFFLEVNPSPPDKSMEFVSLCTISREKSA